MDIKKKLLKLLGCTNYWYDDRGCYRFKWGEFNWHPKPKEWGLSFRYCNLGGYESRNMFVIEPLFFSLYLYNSKEYDLPWDDNGWSYGFYIYDWTDVNYSWGRDRDGCFGIPYRSTQWKSTEVFDVDWNLVYREERGENKITFDKFNTKDLFGAREKASTTYPYRYVTTKGEIQETNASVCIDRMKWSRKWWPFSDLTKDTIDVTFDPFIGDDLDGWKGGTISCGWIIKDGETAEQALRRMEKERRFR